MLYCGLANEGAEEGHAGKWVRLQGSIPALYCGSPAPTRGIEPRLPASHAGGLSNSLGGYRESNQGQTTSTLVASCRPKPATARAPRQRAPFSMDRRPLRPPVCGSSAPTNASTPPRSCPIDTPEMQKADASFGGAPASLRPSSGSGGFQPFICPALPCGRRSPPREIWCAVPKHQRPHEPAGRRLSSRSNSYLVMMIAGVMVVVEATPRRFSVRRDVYRTSMDMSTAFAIYFR